MLERGAGRAGLDTPFFILFYYFIPLNIGEADKEEFVCYDPGVFPR
ncbi:MAG: hypothetical protein ACTSRG_23680 [Candidatus Helarchaeota archaeon]